MMPAAAMREKGRSLLVPAEAYPHLEQGGVVPSWAKSKEAANALRGFVTGGKGRSILKQHRLQLPGA
jgi:hypothetical protein